MRHLLSLPVQHDRDVVTVRQRAGHIAQLLGFDGSEQTRVATAVSEIVRNAFRYAGGGSVTFSVDETSKPQRLVIEVSDRGPGIPHLSDVLGGRYRSSTGMGMGIVGARRLMDRFEIDSTEGGTTVVLEKYLAPRHALITADRAQQIVEAIARNRPDSLIDEIQQQNQALLRALDELQRKQQELIHLNRELEDTNRGVVALYAELDEKADHLRRADELKSRFLSNMTHEFRTPVNSIIGLSNLLIDDRMRERHEPEPEVVYIKKAAEQLSELVNDLLDLAKVEAGKTVIRPTTFEVQNLFGALRGMLRPLLLNQSVSLVFDAPADIPAIYTDEAKLSQILRNLLSNALKFTERGEVRLAATPPDESGLISFTVADTGIGIAEQDLQRIFEEFAQVEHRLQKTVKGTGLGLSLSRRLTELLGGSLSVESELGVGSTFTVSIPSHYHAPRPEEGEAASWIADPNRLPLLVIEDDVDSQYFYEKILRTSAYQVYPAYTAHEAELALDRIEPAAIVLDVMLSGVEEWRLLVRMRRSEKTAQTPIVVVSNGQHRDKSIALGADGFLAKPIDRRKLIDMLAALQTRATEPIRVLLIDDDEVARYLVGQCLPVPLFASSEAASGGQGLELAREQKPDVILLDLLMPDMDGRDGREVMQRLRADAETQAIPVVVVTSQVLSEEERADILRQADGLLSKAEVTRESVADAIRTARRLPSPSAR
jgi:signal transduction histidine kinase/CheY-like chemotaxis protein